MSRRDGVRPGSSAERADSVVSSTAGHLSSHVSVADDNSVVHVTSDVNEYFETRSNEEFIHFAVLSDFRSVEDRLGWV